MPAFAKWCVLLFVVTIAGLGETKASAQERVDLTKPRVWSDASGQFRIEATLVEQTATSIKLRKASDAVIEVPLEKLSAADLALLKRPAAPLGKEQLEARAKALAESALVQIEVQDRRHTFLLPGLVVQTDKEGGEVLMCTQVLYGYAKGAGFVPADAKLTILTKAGKLPAKRAGQIADAISIVRVTGAGLPTPPQWKLASSPSEGSAVVLTAIDLTKPGAIEPIVRTLDVGPATNPPGRKYAFAALASVDKTTFDQQNFAEQMYLAINAQGEPCGMVPNIDEARRYLAREQRLAIQISPLSLLKCGPVLMPIGATLGIDEQKRVHIQGTGTWLDPLRASTGEAIALHFSQIKDKLDLSSFQPDAQGRFAREAKQWVAPVAPKQINNDYPGGEGLKGIEFTMPLDEKPSTERLQTGQRDYIVQLEYKGLDGKTWFTAPVHCRLDPSKEYELAAKRPADVPNDPTVTPEQRQAAEATIAKRLVAVEVVDQGRQRYATGIVYEANKEGGLVLLYKASVDYPGETPKPRHYLHREAKFTVFVPAVGGKTKALPAEVVGRGDRMGWHILRVTGAGLPSPGAWPTSPKTAQKMPMLVAGLRATAQAGGPLLEPVVSPANAVPMSDAKKWGERPASQFYLLKDEVKSLVENQSHLVLNTSGELVGLLRSNHSGVVSDASRFQAGPEGTFFVVVDLLDKIPYAFEPYIEVEGAVRNGADNKPQLMLVLSVFDVRNVIGDRLEALHLVPVTTPPKDLPDDSIWKDKTAFSLKPPKEKLPGDKSFGVAAFDWEAVRLIQAPLEKVPEGREARYWARLEYKSADGKSQYTRVAYVSASVLVP